MQTNKTGVSEILNQLSNSTSLSCDCAASDDATVPFLLWDRHLCPLHRTATLLWPLVRSSKTSLMPVDFSWQPLKRKS